MISVITVCDIAKEYVQQIIENYKFSNNAELVKYWEGVSRDIDDLKAKV